ncbi:MAG: hypothetical protein COV67_06590 [Nitrospinae bacterium CG11_big_fil_rev_8_21_14_0_20_56_8]|nr:MAG: hypothetical protein COV67_06590 [Nitrospinae bacterium CG11_big_fil_rev_8_21_14_0_20_56_8]
MPLPESSARFFGASAPQNDNLALFMTPRAFPNVILSLWRRIWQERDWSMYPDREHRAHKKNLGTTREEILKKP